MSDYNEISGLLPFYVNGTLDAQQRICVEAALKADANLRAELEHERRLKQNIAAGAKAMMENDEGAIEARLGKVMGQLPPQSSVHSLAQIAPPKPGLASALSFLNPRNWHPAVAMAIAAAALAEGGMIASQRGDIRELREENFQLASGEDPRPAAGGILIEIKEDAAWKSISELLDAEGLVIVDSAGFGVLSVKSGKTGAEQDALIARLKKSPLITRAEPQA